MYLNSIICSKSLGQFFVSFDSLLFVFNQNQDGIRVSHYPLDLLEFNFSFEHIFLIMASMGSKLCKLFYPSTSPTDFNVERINEWTDSPKANVWTV